MLHFGKGYESGNVIMNHEKQRQKVSMKTALLLCVSFLIASECLAREQNLKTFTLASGLTLQVPEGVKVQHQKPVEDFDLFIFKKGSTIVLSTYVGNQPDFPKEKNTGVVKKKTINGLNVESVVYSQAKGTMSREVLFHLQETNGWPSRLHCWYVELSPQESAEVDKMLSSVRLKK
jgi:hypothetical protein